MQRRKLCKNHRSRGKTVTCPAGKVKAVVLDWKGIKGADKNFEI